VNAYMLRFYVLEQIDAIQADRAPEGSIGDTANTGLYFIFFFYLFYFVKCWRLRMETVVHLCYFWPLSLLSSTTADRPFQWQVFGRDYYSPVRRKLCTILPFIDLQETKRILI